MAAPDNVKVLELCQVSPPPGAVGTACLQLTCFDIVWVSLPPVQRLFFYKFHESPNGKTTRSFLEDILPNIKRSLSLSLQLFYPLAGNLTQSSEGGDCEIRYVDGDSVSLTIAESGADFHHLLANHPRNIAEFYPLVPQLQLPSSLLALQITIFPNSGISIGICINHVVADGRSLTHFMKSWSSICRTGDDSLITSQPFYDRTTLVEEYDWLKRLFVDQMAKSQADPKQSAAVLQPQSSNVLATFVLSRLNIDKLRKLVMERAAQIGKPVHCSPFVLTCAFISVCLVKARGEDIQDKTVYLVFPVDCRHRLDPPQPTAYFGNCLSPCFVEAKARDLASRDGVFIASKALGSAIQGLQSGIMKDAHNWVERFSAIASHRIISIAGSPKFRVYNTDFGWGRPKKTEVISIGETGAIYIGDSRDEEGGIEVGLAMPEPEMRAFISLFEEGLRF